MLFCVRALRAFLRAFLRAILRAFLRALRAVPAVPCVPCVPVCRTFLCGCERVCERACMRRACWQAPPSSDAMQMREQTCSGGWLPAYLCQQANAYATLAYFRRVCFT